VKQELSSLELKTTLGFIYWVNETHNLRGLKNTSIEEYPQKIKELQKEYNLKYPNGLTGWSK
jgi:hypothetical protein